MSDAHHHHHHHHDEGDHKHGDAGDGGKEHFSGLAEVYDDMLRWTGMYEPVHRFLTTSTPVDWAKCDVLDFGAGTGFITMQLAPLARSVTALDVNDKMLAVLRANAASKGLDNVR